MPDSRRVTMIERRLGFKWELGMSRSKAESCKIRIIKALIDDIDRVKQRWVYTAPKELRNHAGFERHCLTLYDKHAHRIWPPPPADRSAWLVDADCNDWAGEYPRNLSIDLHDHLLRDLFISLVFEKCVRYHENQKQEERRQYKLSINRDTSELSSPPPESESEERTNLSHQNERSTVTSSSTARLQNSQASDAATSLGKNEAVRSMGAPVAQMIPHTSGSVRRDGSRSRMERVVLDDSDEEDMFGSPSEPANGISLRGSTVVGNQRYPVEKNNHVENGAIPGRKRPAPSYFEDVSPAKKSNRKGTARVKVRYLSSNSSSRTRLLASFKFTPKILAAILQRAPRSRNASYQSTESQSDLHWTNLSKATSKVSKGLHVHQKAEASGSTVPRVIKLHAPKAPSERKTPPPPPSGAKTDLGSTIHVSTSRTNGNAESIIMQNDSRHQPKPTQGDRSGGRLVSATSSEKRFPATATATARTSKQAASLTISRPSEPESVGSAIGADGSIYDFIVLPDDPDGSTFRAGWTSAKPRLTQPEPFVSSTSGRLVADSNTTSQPKRLSYNEHSKKSSTSHMSIQSASDAPSNDIIGEQSGIQIDKAENAIKTIGPLQVSKVETSIPRNVYVEDGSEADDPSKPKERSQVSAVSEGISASHSSPSNCANGRNNEPQTPTLADEQSGSMITAIAEEMAPGSLASAAEIDGYQVQADKNAGSSPTPRQSVQSPSAAPQNPADKVAELQPKVEPNTQTTDLSMESTLEILAELKAKMQALADTSQPFSTTPKGEQMPLTEAARPKTAIQEPNSKKLFLQLSTSEANKQQFIVVTFDVSVEELFERVQKRMNKRVDNKAIQCLQLRLPTQLTDEDPYLVQNDDPDTWEWFLEMAREVEGSKIKVLADVEL